MTRFAAIKVCLFLLLSLSIAQGRKVGNCLKNVQGSRCSQPGAHWQHDGVCIIEPSKPPACHVPETRHFKFLLVAKIKPKGSQTIKSLWVRGAGPTLSWDKPRQMQKSARNLNEWNLEVSYATDSNALLCLNTSYCSLNQHSLELRVYRDEIGNDDMLGPNFYIPLPVSRSMSGVPGFTVPRVTIQPWFDCATVRTETVKLSYKSYLSKAGETVTITSTIIYPPSFNCNIHRHYPLVIMFGTNEPLHISPLLEHMFVHEASINEAVVVSIHYLDKAPFCAFSPFDELARMTEVNTVWDCRARDKECHSCQTCWDAQRTSKCTKRDFIAKAKRCLTRYACSGSATDILDFIQGKLILELRRRTHDRLQLDFPRQRMSIIGFSGAGLLASFAALSRPLYYANAGCLSANFEWPVGLHTFTANRSTEGMGKFIQDLNTMLSIDPARIALHSFQKYYIDFGEHDYFYLPHIDPQNYTEWVIGMLEDTLHLKPNENILYFHVPKAGNSYYHHKDGGTEVFNRVRQSLLFFLRAEGGPNKKFARVPKVGDTSFAERQGDIGMTEQGLEDMLSSEENGTITSSSEGHCPFGNQRIHSRKQQPSVPIPAFLLSIGMSMLVSVMLTAGFMYLREVNKKAEAKEKAEEEDDLMDKLGSSLEDLDD